MSRRVIVLGGGGHGRVVLNTLRSSDVSVSYLLDPALPVGERVFGVTVMGGDECLDRFEPGETLLVNGLGANPSVSRRQQVFEGLTDRGFSFGSVCHPSAIIGCECLIGPGSQILAGAVLQNRVTLSDNVVINTRASIDHDCVIGPHSFVSPGVVLTGNVRAGASVFLGAGAIVLPGCEIGAHAIVGAGAVVLTNVPAGWIVAGNPAVKIGTNK